MSKLPPMVERLLEAPQSPRLQRAEHLALVGAAAVALSYGGYVVFVRDGVRATAKRLVGGILSAARSVPGVAGALDSAVEAQLAPLADELAPPDATALTVIPAAGTPHADVAAEIERMLAADVAASGFTAGRSFAGIYHHPTGPLNDMHARVLGACINTNALYPGVFRCTRKMEAEAVAMVVSMMKGQGLPAGAPSAAAADPAPDACGLMTTGGTESVIMAVKSYRDAYLAAHGYESIGAAAASGADLNVVACVTAHPALDKACAVLGLRLVKLPADPVTQALTPPAVSGAIGRDTLFVYASAPSFPHGVVDPIPGIAAVTRAAGVGLHVDNCLGGILLSCAYAAQQQQQAATSAGGAGTPSATHPIPCFDFRVEGVTTMSCDVHKYGWAPKGCSVVAYRTKALRRHAYTAVSDWPGGLYTTPTMVGSKSGAPAAVAWATLKAVGAGGYLASAVEVQALYARVASAIAATPGLVLVGAPAACIIAFTVAPSFPCSVYALAARMEEQEGGHHVATLQGPPAAHVCITERFGDTCDAWLAALKAAVADALAAGTSPVPVVDPSTGRTLAPNASFEGKGSAGIYGASAVLPASEVGRILERYCDILTLVRKA